MFNSQKQFVVPILSGTRKECRVRYPSDVEWCERARKQRSIRRFLGRGKSESQDLNSDAVNAELLDRIRVDGDAGAVFDGAEAGAVISKLERATVEAIDREGDNFRLSLKVPGAVTEHLVRMPTRTEMDRYEVASVKVTGQRRAQEIRGFLEPSGELYDAIRKDVSGYEGEVPIVHKVAVVTEVLGQMATDDEEAVPEA
jgi:hypothetical protein